MSPLWGVGGGYCPLTKKGTLEFMKHSFYNLKYCPHKLKYTVLINSSILSS